MLSASPSVPSGTAIPLVGPAMRTNLWQALTAPSQRTSNWQNGLRRGSVPGNESFT